jgi:hypothetical protein
MVIVLFLGFLLIALLAIWLKRRHKRRKEEKIAQSSGFPMTQKKSGGPVPTGATPDLWGPHQYMAATEGYQYPPGGLFAGSHARRSSRRRSKSKTKGHTTEVDEISEIKPDRSTKPGRSKSSRPRPSELDVDLRAAEFQRGRSKNLPISEKDLKQDHGIGQGFQSSHIRSPDEKEDI